MASRANSAAERRLTGLVVDAGRTCQAIEKGLLVRYGVQTHVVDKGQDAVDLFADGREFDIMLIDLSLPDISGLEAIRQIREMGVDCKIVGLAAYGLEEERTALLAAGADEFFEKPVPPQHLVRILRDIIRNGN